MKRARSRYHGLDDFGSGVFPGGAPRLPGEAEPVLEHTVLHSDRLDRIADRYFRDDRRWWRLLDANPEFLYGFEVTDIEMHGDTLLIPSLREST